MNCFCRVCVPRDGHFSVEKTESKEKKNNMSDNKNAAPLAAHDAEWKEDFFSICCFQSGNGFSRRVMKGLTNDVFGIDERRGAFWITHLATGWECFICRTLSGAKTVAEYLRANYREKLALVRVSGSDVTNVVELHHRIAADEKLRKLTDELALPKSERRAKRFYAEIKGRFLS